MKNKKLISMFMMFLVLTLPIASGQIIRTDNPDQGRNIGDEVGRRLSESPTVSDIVGEDIIINVKEYQPSILRTGLLEDQGAVVYAILSGTPSNPAITVPKIHDIDILSYNVVTVPEGLPLRVGRPRYFRDRTQPITYDNMGYLQIPIPRIPKESNVPDNIIIEVDSRVLFDVSAGIGKSPTKMVIREKSTDRGNSENQKYLNIYIEAEEISSNYAIFDIYDNNRNLIEDDLRLEKGKKSRTLRRDRFYSPGQVFDKFNIYLKDIKSGGRTMDIMVLREGVPETHTISEGESIYPGSGITLERIEVRGDKIHADFRTPSGIPKTAGFPRSIPDAAGEIKFEELSRAETPAGDLIECGGQNIADTIKDSKNLLDLASTPDNYNEILEKIEPCVNIFNDDPSLVPKEHIVAMQSLLITIETNTAARLVEENSFEKIHSDAEITLNEFLIKYREAYHTPKFSLGAIAGDAEVKELYELSADEYASVVSLVKGDMEVNYGGTTSGSKTTIPEFYAQYNKAVIYHAKIKDIGKAIKEYNTLLDIVNSYEGNKKTEAETIISSVRIQSRINLLTAFLKDPSGMSLRAEIDLKEKDGEVVTVVLDGSSITDYQLEGSQSTATVSIYKPEGSAAGEPHILKEGEPIPFIEGATPWIIEKITSSSIIIKPSDKDYKTTAIPRDNRNGISVPIKVGEKSTTQRVVLESVELHNEAHIIVSPNIEKAFSAARFNLHIPIEKRAFDLPLFSASIESEIDKTEKLLLKLDDTLEKVGKIHEAWKKFCFGVYTAIAAWNFLKAAVGSGSGRAKDKASEEFWSQNGSWCQSKGYSMDECVFEREDAYNKILTDTEEAYKYASEDSYGGELGSLKKGEENKVQMENLAYLQKRMQQNASAQNTKKYLLAYTNAVSDKNYKEALDDTGKNERELTDEERQKLKLAVAERDSEMFKELRSSYSTYSDHLTTLDVSRSSVYLPKDNKVFVGELTKFKVGSTSEALKESVEEIWISRETATLMREDSELSKEDAEKDAKSRVFSALSGVNFVHTSPNGGLILFGGNGPGDESLLSPDGKTYTLSSTSVQERIEHKPIVTYYIDGPNAGKLHRISVDATNYAEIEYTSGGRMLEPRIFGRTDPNSEIRADGSEYGGGGLNAVIERWNKDGHDTSDLKKIESCVGTINKAKASKRDMVVCSGINYAIRNDPAIKGPACVEFYSPTECKLLFNACDPVLCPPTRFDLGGKWKVDNVAETGIIGSTILGLHNFGIPGTDIGFDGGQVVMPVCITGIYAGLQNIRTVLMEYSDCLKRSLVDDESVGICDMLRSYYICDVLWKEAIAIFNIKSGLVGTALKALNDEGEGSEYTDFDASMDQSINGLKYFTQGYAKNTFAQFSGGALPEIGAEVCKAAVYGKVPGVGSFTDRLMQPESPPQFTATMDAVPYSDIPFPPQTTYKVYYRMYAGANEPLSFSVYLKHQAIDGQSGLPIAWLVRNKRLEPDAFDSENVDFNAPEGYNQVCMAYSSPTYGVREECGFGKTTSGFAINYIAQKMAEKEAGQGGIQTAEQCNPSGSSLSGPYSSYGAKAGAVAVGGFSSGLLDTGITRVCSTFPPGEDADWKQVGECWEGPKPEEGRHLGYCWLHLPSTKDIVTKFSVNKEIDWANFSQSISGPTQETIDRISDYVSKLGINTVYLTTEDIKEAEKRIQAALSKDPKDYEEAINIYRDIIDNNGLADPIMQVELKLKLADLYREFASLIENKLAESPSDEGGNTGARPDKSNNIIDKKKNFCSEKPLCEEYVGENLGFCEDSQCIIYARGTCKLIHAKNECTIYNLFPGRVEYTLKYAPLNRAITVGSQDNPNLIITSIFKEIELKKNQVDLKFIFYDPVSMKLKAEIEKNNQDISMRTPNTGSIVTEITPEEMLQKGLASGDYGLSVIIYGLDYDRSRESALTFEVDTSKIPGGKLTLYI